MKNLFTIITFTILGSVLFSCGSSLTVTKRRVNKGFYIASNNNKGISKHVKENEADKPYHKPISEIAIAPEEMPQETVIARNETPVAQAEQELQADGTVTESTPQPASVKHKIIQKKMAAAESTKRIIEKVSYQPKKHLQKMKQSASPQPIVGAVLSLFWIVILIIFLLYLVGLLAGGFGLGGLIHLLLVITLILLILWLLGIV
ncbi:MAG: hypothetical protein K0R65_1850 [Crocinitomicaceae bacterium]|nr:hypothetical protein [Crocinitomicaceae bacterium]